MKVRQGFVSNSSSSSFIIDKTWITHARSGRCEDITIDTWSYTSSMEKYDLLFHNPPQYVSDNTKHVLFRVYTDGSNVVFNVVWWKNNPKPTEEVMCLHLGRLTEMLLANFRGEYSKLSIVE